MAKLIINGNELCDSVLAVSRDEHTRGLMEVPWPPPIMSFISKNSEIKKFWMKNTPSPLDIIFCNNGEVIHIAKGKPFDTTLIGPNIECNLVVEGPQGFSEKNNITLGSKIRLKFEKNELSNIIKVFSKEGYDNDRYYSKMW